MVKIYCYTRNDYSAEITDSSMYGTFSSLIPTNSSAMPLVDNKLLLDYLSFDGKGIDLNENYKSFYSSGEYIGFLSQDVSDSECQLSNLGCAIHFYNDSKPFELTDGITIHLYGECCSDILLQFTTLELTNEFVEYHNLSGEIIHLDVPAEYKNTFYSFTINFLKTKISNQFLKISSIRFSNLIILEKFKNINLLEEINVLSDDLPINSLEFSVVTDNPLDIQKDDELFLYSNGKYYGTFYPETAERVSQFNYSVKAYNSIQKLDNTEYFHFDAIQQPLSHCLYGSYQICDVSGVTIDTSELINDYYISGHIPINTCRYALCAIAFASRFMIDGSRSDKIILRKIPQQISSVISSSDKRIIGNCTFTKSKPFSAAILSIPQYTGMEDIEINCSEIIPEISSTDGYDYNVYFNDAPIVILDAETTGDYVEIDKSLNHIFFESSGGDIVLKGYKHIIRTQEFKIFNDSGTNNEFKFNKFNLGGIGTDYIDGKMSDIEKFVNSKGTIKAKIILDSERVGDLIEIETAYDGFKTGIITSMNVHFGYRDVADIEVLEWQIG